MYPHKGYMYPRLGTSDPTSCAATEPAIAHVRNTTSDRWFIVHSPDRSGFKSAMSNPNDLLNQKLCHYLNQGRTFNGLL